MTWTKIIGDLFIATTVKADLATYELRYNRKSRKGIVKQFGFLSITEEIDDELTIVKQYFDKDVVGSIEFFRKQK